MDLPLATPRNVPPLYNNNSLPKFPIASTLKSSEPPHQVPKKVASELQAADIRQTFHCLLCDYCTKDSSRITSHEKTCLNARIAMNPSPNSPSNTPNGSAPPNASQPIRRTNHEPPDKPEYPWKDNVPTTTDYPGLVTIRLTIQKEPSKVPDQIWPWKRTTTGKYLNVDYFKHLGYGQPPESLPGNQGDLFIDFTTPDFPLVYFYNNGWLDYNADSVIKNDRKTWLGILEHPLFPDRYLWSAEKKGLYWTGHSVFNGSSLACLNDDREEANEWYTKYLCDSFQMLSMGSRWDLAKIPDGPTSQSKLAAEIQRRARIHIPPSLPKPPAQPPPVASSSLSRRTSSRQSSESSKPRKHASVSRPKSVQSSSGISIIIPPRQSRDHTPKRKKPSISSSTRTPPTSRRSSLTPIPSSPDYDIAPPPTSIPSYDMEVDPPPRVFQATAAKDMDVDKEPALRSYDPNSDGDPDLDETLKRVQRILEERKKHHQKHLGALQTITKLRRELQQADEARVFAEQRAAEAELELENLRTEGWRSPIESDEDHAFAPTPEHRIPDSSSAVPAELEELRVKHEKLRQDYEKQSQELSEAREEAARLIAESETTREAVAKLKVILAADDEEDS